MFLCDQSFGHLSPIYPLMAARLFRPGQFGVFTVVKPDFDLNATITRALSKLTKLRLKSVEWLDLGGGILAKLQESRQNDGGRKAERYHEHQPLHGNIAVY
jgi:hypothetical protein